MLLPTLYRFPLGRCEFALREVARRATVLNKTDITALAGRGADRAKSALKVSLLSQNSHSGQYPPEAAGADNLVDHCVAGTDGYLELQARVYQGEERAAAAERLRAELLPQGVAAITKLPYTEQHAQVNTMLERADDAELAADVAALPEMRSLLERVRTFNISYGNILSNVVSRASSDERRQAQQSCQELLYATAGLIIGHYALHDPDNTAERDHLLEPILHQNAAIGAARRQRRLPRDVDPGTGDELPQTEPVETPQPTA
jgi:hypothetical protein